MQTEDRIRRFLSSTRFAVAGASADRTKYGNKVLRCYPQHGHDVVAIHPRETEIEGVAAYRRLADVPRPPEAISVVTPPPVTESLVEEAAAMEIRRIWMQPGAESAAAIRRCAELGIDVIAGGPCLLVALGFRDA